MKDDQGLWKLVQYCVLEFKRHLEVFIIEKGACPYEGCADGVYIFGFSGRWAAFIWGVPTTQNMWAN